MRTNMHTNVHTYIRIHTHARPYTHIVPCSCKVDNNEFISGMLYNGLDLSKACDFSVGCTNTKYIFGTDVSYVMGVRLGDVCV